MKYVHIFPLDYIKRDAVRLWLKFSNIIPQPVQSVLLSPLCNYKATHVDNDYIHM